MLHPLAASTRRVTRMALACAVAAGMMGAGVMAVHPPSANAGDWSEKGQPAKSWSIVENIGEGLHFQYARARTTSTICVGPITGNGKIGWSAPYGWGCHAEEVEWNYSALTAYPAFYNPNNNEVKEPYGSSEF